MYNEQNLPRSRENSDLAKAVELNSQELSSFSTKFHGSCAKCHHFHVGLPLTINNKPDHHERIYCEKCNHVLFGLGRGSPQVSLASVETKNTLPTKPISSPVRQSEKSNNPETKSIPTIPDPSTTPLSGPKTNERSIHNIKSSTKPGQISIGNPSSKYAFSSTKTKRAKTVLQGISSTARKLKPSFRKRTFSKPLVNVDACQTPEIPVAQEDARPVDDQFNMMSLISWGVPHRELSGREMIPSLSLPSQEEMRMTPELPNNPSSPLLPHNSENISDKVRNKHLEKISLGRDNRFRSASVPPNQRSDDQNFQKSSLERKENSSWSSIFSVESSISIRYRSQDGQRQRIESHSKSKIALENYKESKEGFTPSVGDFFLADNDDSDDDDNHGSTHSRVVQVEPKNSPAEKMDANGFSSGESDHASAFRESDGRITRLENNFLRLRFRCRCGHQFKIDILEHQRDAAMELLKAFDDSPDPERKSNYFSLLQRILKQARLLLGTKEMKRVDHVLPVSRDNANDADNLAQSSLDSLPPEPDRYICACFPGTNYKKYLHHVDANKARTDPMLFQALREKYFNWRPLWKRMLALRVLARVEYFEFQIFYSNLVIIHEDWKDRFPRDHAPGEWLYIPSSRDTTPYLFDDILTHYVQNPGCAKNCTYFWNRIPKKVKQPLECPDGQQSKVGWGLYFIEEFSQLYLLLVLLPILLAGFVIAGLYCQKWGKSFSDGATVLSAFAAVVMYLFGVAQGWGRQRGIL